MQSKFEAKQAEIFEEVGRELTGDSPQAYKDMREEMQVYISYIVNEMLMDDTGILDKNAIDKSRSNISGLDTG